MDAAPKREVGTVRAADIEPVGLVEHVRVAVGGADQDGEVVAGADLEPVHRAVGTRTPDGDLHRGIEAEQLLDDGGHEILRRGDGLLDRDGALDAVLPADRSRLRRLLARALPEMWGEAPGGGSMTVQRPSGRSRLALHVSPVGDGRADFGGRRVVALALMVDPARRPHIDARRVATTLGLTPSEGRMSALLAEGLKVSEIAAAAGWRESYVRWTIQQVYRKLGASGQVDLVRQVLAADSLPRR